MKFKQLAARAALVLLATIAARPLTAQQVRGVVRDSVSAQPIPGAVVSLLDSLGHVSVRGIADEQGRFLLTPAGAVKRVQVVRIGFHPRDLPLPAAATASLIITMVHLPAMLESIRVSDQALCPGSNDRGDAFSLWEQARAALLATIVARETKPANVLMLTYQREIDPGNESIMHQTVHAHRGVSGRPFTASHPASEFAKIGYMQETEDGDMFSAPDADVLLDESFAATHCFRVLKGTGDHNNQVGLGFEPAPGRGDLVDVGGVLWIDRANPVLRTLEYHYTGVEPAAVRAHAGGLLVFRAMSNGVVFIERWFIRMAAVTAGVPTLGHSDDDVPRAQRSNARVRLIQEAGGEVAEASWPDGLHWEGVLGRIHGRLLQTGSGQPLANMRVTLDENGEISTTTDSTGTFSFRQVLPGPYVLWATDGTLAGYGVVRRANLGMMVERGKEAEGTMFIVPFSDVVEPLCRDQPNPRGSATLLGRVQTSTGTLVSEATVHIDWSVDSASSQPSAASTRTVVSDSTGHFHVCGVPRGRALNLRILRDSLPLAAATVHVARDDSYGTVTLALPPVIKP